MMRRPVIIFAMALVTAACGGSPAETLIGQIRLGDPQAATTYAENKEAIDSAEVRPIWVEALRSDESVAVRTWAVQILGASGDAGVLPELVSAMSDVREVREAAIDAIRSLPADQAAGAFGDAVRSGNRDAQVSALGQIARLGNDAATAAVAEAARSADSLVARTAANTLGDLASDAAVAALGAIVADPAVDMEQRNTALSNLARIDSTAASDQLAAAIEALSAQEGAEELLAAAQQLQR